MNDSILENVAEVILGSIDDLEAFSGDLIMYINSALMTLNQLGVGSENFRVTGPTETWGDFVADESKYGALQECVTMKVRLAFDQPQSSSAVEAIKEIIKEDEFRLMIQADPISRGDGQ